MTIAPSVFASAIEHVLAGCSVFDAADKVGISRNALNPVLLAAGMHCASLLEQHGKAVGGRAKTLRVEEHCMHPIKAGVYVALLAIDADSDFIVVATSGLKVGATVRCFRDAIVKNCPAYAMPDLPVLPYEESITAVCGKPYVGSTPYTIFPTNTQNLYRTEDMVAAMVNIFAAHWNLCTVVDGKTPAMAWGADAPVPVEYLVPARKRGDKRLK